MGLFDKKGQYAKIKVTQKSKKAEQIKANAVRQEKKALSKKSTLTSNVVAPNKSYFFKAPSSSSFLSFNIPTIPISLKKDNQ